MVVCASHQGALGRQACLRPHYRQGQNQDRDGRNGPIRASNGKSGLSFGAAASNPAWGLASPNPCFKKRRFGASPRPGAGGSPLMIRTLGSMLYPDFRPKPPLSLVQSPHFALQTIQKPWRNSLPIGQNLSPGSRIFAFNPECLS